MQLEIEVMWATRTSLLHRVVVKWHKLFDIVGLWLYLIIPILLSADLQKLLSISTCSQQLDELQVIRGFINAAKRLKTLQMRLE
ncbi:hypothetical protein P8452_42317 [Trifolium repens]|nr:hypothetical protein P8452_42317 [Trifolium repens]